jgi:hypothetical protein
MKSYTLIQAYNHFYHEGRKDSDGMTRKEAPRKDDFPIFKDYICELGYQAGWESIRKAGQS